MTTTLPLSETLDSRLYQPGPYPCRCGPPAHTFSAQQDRTPDGTICYCGAMRYFNRRPGWCHLEPVDG